MNKKTLLLIIPMIFSLASCGDETEEEAKQDSREKYNLTQLRKYNGGQVDIEDSRLYEYLNLTDEHDMAEFLFKNQPKGFPLFKTDVTLTVDWYGGVAPYKLVVSDKSDFSNVIFEKTMNTHNYDLSSTLFCPSTHYYYRVSDSNNGSFTDSFVTKESPIIWTVDGTTNVRDLGGWSTDSGKKILYNKIYRGANVDYLTEAGKDTFLNKMGIKADLDLRGILETEKDHIDELLEKGSPSGCEKYLNARINTYNDITTYPSTQNPVYKQAFEYLADSNNYPMYFHCTHGADRTGTLAFLLGGLLGVSLEDLTKDFELTSFYYTMTRWRSNIISSNNVYSFGDSGKQASDVRFGPLHDDLISNWGITKGAADNSLKAAVENYVINGLGITQAQVDNIRLELLGE